jgi:hypothetical protein
VNIAQLPVAELTGIDIRVGYVVESLSDFVDFEVALERNILAAATVGVLDCIDGGPVFRVGGEVPNNISNRSGQECRPRSCCVLGICPIAGTYF